MLIFYSLHRLLMNSCKTMVTIEGLFPTINIYFIFIYSL